MLSMTPWPKQVRSVLGPRVVGTAGASASSSSSLGPYGRAIYEPLSMRSSQCLSVFAFSSAGALKHLSTRCSLAVACSSLLEARSSPGARGHLERLDRARWLASGEPHHVAAREA
jgi:hypothetical protein